jgi:cytochrome c-type biogenesis protein CcmF
MCTLISEFHRGANARRKQGESYLEALWILTFRNTRRYGGYIVHMGMVFMFVGFAGAGFNHEVQKEMAPGDNLSIGRYTLTLEQVKNTENDNYASAIGLITVYKEGTLVDTLLPERRFYKASDQDTTEVALRSGLKEDLYVVLAGFNKESTRPVFHAYLNPLVSWIWIGGVTFVLGTLICLIPSRQGMAKSKSPAGVKVEEYAKT